MYNKLLMAFDKQVVVSGEFEVNVEINESYIGCSWVQKTSLNATNIYNPSDDTYGDKRKLIIVELEDCINNAVGDITVRFISGLSGNTGMAVQPFEMSFTPTSMPEYALLRAADGIRVTKLQDTSLIKPINKTSNNTNEDTCIISIMTNKILTCSLSFVGQINP